MKKKQKQEREELESRLRNDEKNIGVLSTERRRSSRNSSSQQETEEEKQRCLELSAKCKMKAEEIKTAKSDDDDSTSHAEPNDDSTSCNEPNNGDDEEDEIVILNDETLRFNTKNIHILIREEQEATGKELSNEKCKSRIRVLLKDANQTSNIDNKYIEHIMFLSDSSDDEPSNQKTMKNQDIPEIEDKLFLLSEKELEVIDHLLLFEIRYLPSTSQRLNVEGHSQAISIQRITWPILGIGLKNPLVCLEIKGLKKLMI